MQFSRRSLIAAYLFSVVILGNVGAVSAQQPVDSSNSYYSIPNRLLFAKYLYNSEDYGRAATELKTVLQSVISGECRDSIQFMIGLSYYKSHRYLFSRDAVRPLLAQQSHEPNNSNAYYLTALGYLHSQDPDSVQAMPGRYSQPGLTPAMRYRSQILQGLGYFYDRKWAQARDKFASIVTQIPNNSSLSLLVQEHLALSQTALVLPHKNPVVSGVLSAFIPGAGRIYLGRTGEGIFSFLTIGILTYNSYNGFAEDGVRSIYGWVNALPALALYLGNVYGSITGAYIYNEQQVQQIYKAVSIPDENLFIHP